MISHLFAEASEPHGILAVVGRFHPLVLHVPIGAIVLLGAIELLAWFLGVPEARRSVGILAWCAAASAVVSLGTGYVLSFEGTYSDADVEIHRNYAIAFTAATLLAACCHTKSSGGRSPFGSGGRSPLAARLYWVFLAAALVLIFPTGHHGASMTHGEDFLFAPIRGGKASAPAAGTSESKPASASTVASADASALYATRVAPILEAKCVGCHGGEQTKAKLSLASLESIRAGGKSGAVLDDAAPADSLLLRKVKLGLDEKGHMPPKTKPQLTPAELSTIESWVLEGVGSAAPIESRHAAPGSGAHAKPKNTGPDPAALAALRAKLVHAQATERDSSLIWVDFAAPASRLTEEEIVGLLTPLRDQVAELALNRSKVGDGAFELIGGMPHLRRLEARQTAVGDAAIAKLERHPALEELVLTQTKVSDASIDALIAIPNLRKLYLWGSAVTPAGLARLREGSAIGSSTGATAPTRRPSRWRRRSS